MGSFTVFFLSFSLYMQRGQMSGKERNGKWALCVRVTRLLLTCWEKKEISREETDCL